MTISPENILEVFIAVVPSYQKLASEDKCQNNPPKFEVLKCKLRHRTSIMDIYFI
jgi:hypothetical protein